MPAITSVILPMRRDFSPSSTTAGTASWVTREIAAMLSSASVADASPRVAERATTSDVSWALRAKPTTLLARLARRVEASTMTLMPRVCTPAVSAIVWAAPATSSVVAVISSAPAASCSALAAISAACCSVSVTRVRTRAVISRSESASTPISSLPVHVRSDVRSPCAIVPACVTAAAMPDESWRAPQVAMSTAMMSARSAKIETLRISSRDSARMGSASYVATT